MRDAPSSAGEECGLGTDPLPGALDSVPESFVVLGDARTVAAGTVGGLAGAVATAFLGGGPALGWVLLGIGCGAMTGAVAGPFVASPGDGLVRGLAIGVVSWLLVLVALSLGRDGMMMQLPVVFPLFVQTTLGLGAPAGLAVGVLESGARPPGTGPGPDPLGFGVLSGLVAGAAFGTVTVQQGLLRSPSRLAMVGSPVPAAVVFYAVAGALGALFAWLFDAEIRTAGSALLYGLGYGLFWWLLGALTLLPLLRTGTVAWTSAGALARLHLLLGHAVFGILLDTGYAVLRRLWRGLTVDPDPVEPGTGGVTVEIARASLRGVGASLLGGLAFGVVLWQTGELATIAGLVGQSSPAVGLVVHMSVAVVIGSGYGQLFRYEAPDVGAGALWGVVYGVVWWVLGPLTLLPLLLNSSPTWTAAAAELTVPMLTGHLVYGAHHRRGLHRARTTASGLGVGRPQHRDPGTATAPPGRDRGGLAVAVRARDAGRDSHHAVTVTARPPGRGAPRRTPWATGPPTRPPEES